MLSESINCPVSPVAIFGFLILVYCFFLASHFISVKSHHKVLLILKVFLYFWLYSPSTELNWTEQYLQATIKFMIYDWLMKWKKRGINQMSLIAYVQMKLCFSLFFQLFFIILKISPDFRHFIADYSKGFYFSLVFSFFLFELLAVLFRCATDSWWNYWFRYPSVLLQSVLGWIGSVTEPVRHNRNWNEVKVRQEWDSEAKGKRYFLIFRGVDFITTPSILLQF